MGIKNSTNDEKPHNEMQFEDDSNGIIASIKKLLYDEDKKARLAGVWALSQIFSQTEKIQDLFDVLANELSSPDIRIRNAAIMVILLAARTKEKREKILDRVIQMIAHDNALLRRTGTILIMMLYRESGLEEHVIDKLLELINDYRRYVRNTAITTLLSFAEENGLEKLVLNKLVAAFYNSNNEEILKTLSFGIVHLLEQMHDENIIMETLNSLISSLSSPSYSKVLQTIILIAMLVEKFKLEKQLLQLLKKIVIEKKNDLGLLRGISLLISSQFRGRGLSDVLEIAKIMITSDDRRIREAGVAMLSSVFRKSNHEEKVLDALLEIISTTSDRNIRIGAIVCLTEIFRSSGKELTLANVLLDFMKNGDDELKIISAVAIGELFREKKEREILRKILKRLMDFLQISDPVLHYASLLAISNLLEGTGDTKYLATLSKMLKSNDENLRYLTVLSLGLIFRRRLRKEVLELLSPLVDDPCWLVREAIAFTLSEVNDEKTLKHAKKILEKLMHDPVESVKISAKIALAKIYYNIGKKKEFEKMIEEMLKSNDWKTRVMTLQILANIFSDINLIIPYLKKSILDKEPLIRLTVIDIISNLVDKKIEKELISILKQLVYDKDWRISHAALMTLADILVRIEKEDIFWEILEKCKMMDKHLAQNFAEAIAYMLTHSNKPENIIKKMKEMAFSKDKSKQYTITIIVTLLMKMISNPKIVDDLKSITDYLKQNAGSYVRQFIETLQKEDDALFT